MTEQSQKELSIIERCKSPSIKSMITFTSKRDEPFIIATFYISSSKYKAFINVNSEIVTIEDFDAYETNHLTALGEVSLNVFNDVLDGKLNSSTLFNK